MLPLEKLSSIVTDQQPQQRRRERRRGTGPGRVPSHRQSGIPIAAVMPTAFQ